jgi:hypothetical protein
MTDPHGWRPISTAQRKVRGQTVYSAEERLARMSRLDDVTGCVLWTGTTRNGYGRLVFGARTEGRRTVAAHRLAFETWRGPIPAGMEVCHHCDVRACINPDHLFVGTKQDNMADRKRKGRNRPPRGEDHVFSKLSDDAVREIRSSAIPARELAVRFQVTVAAIKDVRGGRRWRHVIVPPPPGEGSDG